MDPRPALTLLLLGLASLGCQGRGAAPAEASEYEVKWVPFDAAKSFTLSSLTVVSANLRVDLPGDGENRWEYRRDLLLKVLAESEPDVIGTQEGWRRQLEDLDASLPDMTLVDAHRQWNAERLYPSILVNHERIEVEKSGDFWLSASPDVPDSKLFWSRYPRMASWAVAREKQTGQRLFLVNTHLTYLFGFVRAEQASILAAEVERLNPAALPVVLVGDFNEGPEGDVRATLEEALPGLIDPWQLLGESEVDSYHGFGSGPRSGRIDWVLLDRCFEPLGVFVLTRLDYDPSRGRVVYPSDHLPVAAKAALCGP